MQRGQKSDRYEFLKQKGVVSKTPNIFDHIYAKKRTKILKKIHF